VVRFPFPEAAQRQEIWRRIFPTETPTRDLDTDKLARLEVAGGQIRDIALNAAFLAADEGASVQMRHLAAAARAESARLNRPLTDLETAGWA
jgi:ATP-dependent 26S proteasome regulatory subunit